MEGFLDNSRPGECRRLIDRVAVRLRLAAFGRVWLAAMAGLGIVCLVSLLIRRVGGLGPEWLTVEVLAGVPVLAALLAVVRSGRPSVLAAAREIDRRCGTSDLFLTLAQLDAAAGGYQPLIARQAELRAVEIAPSAVVSWNWRRPMLRLFGGFGVLMLALLFLPQLDPFGAVDTATAAVAVRRDLQESRRETAIRAAEISARQESETVSGEIEQTLSELAAELRQLRADRSSASLKSLEVRQREIESRWRDARSVEEMARLLEQSQATQFFGPADKRTREWTQELAKGQTESLDEAFDTLHQSLEKLASTTDAAEQQQLDLQARQALAELQRFAGSQLRSRPIEAALKRATSQLDAARHDPGLLSEAAEAARESLELAETELQNVARNAEQLASLEQALNAIQSAKQLGQQNPQRASDENESTVQEFVEQYAQLQGEKKDQRQTSEQSGRDQTQRSQGQPGEEQPGQSQQVSASGAELPPDSSKQAGQGSVKDASTLSPDGTPGNGPGNANLPPENELAKTGFRNARETADIDASRRLMLLRQQGLAESGESSQEYRELVKALQKRVSTAIEVEEIPPGYVAGIRSYFDSLEQQTNVGEAVPDASEVADEAP